MRKRNNEDRDDGKGQDIWVVMDVGNTELRGAFYSYNAAVKHGLELVRSELDPTRPEIQEPIDYSDELVFQRLVHLLADECEIFIERTLLQ